MGMKTSVGTLAPQATRIASMLMGIMVRLEVFSTRNMICGSDAFSWSGFTSCNSFMAFKPRGVAALSKPKHIGAEIHHNGAHGRMVFGYSRKYPAEEWIHQPDSALTAPPFSPIFIIPSQSVITPIR